MVSPRDHWPVPDPRRLPAELVERAARSQASLASSLRELRALALTFPDADEPATGLRWIEAGGHSRHRTSE
jgi:hypothetical protein